MDWLYIERTRLWICRIFFVLVSCLAFFWTLKMEVTCASETSVTFQLVVWHYILEDSHQYFDENQSSHTFTFAEPSLLSATVGNKLHWIRLRVTVAQKGLKRACLYIHLLIPDIYGEPSSKLGWTSTGYPDWGLLIVFLSFSKQMLYCIIASCCTLLIYSCYHLSHMQHVFENS
jgi:hypothetical protein